MFYHDFMFYHAKYTVFRKRKGHGKEIIEKNRHFDGELSGGSGPGDVFSCRMKKIFPGKIRTVSALNLYSEIFL
jgi:hypothetical protein